MPDPKQNLLDQITSELASTEVWLSSILKRLGWTEDGLLKVDGDRFTYCTIDKSHRIPTDSVHEHEERCKLQRTGLSKQEIELLPETDIFSTHSNVVTVGPDELSACGVQALPGVSHLTSDDRLRLYDRCIQVSSARRRARGITHDDVAALDVTESDKAGSQDTTSTRSAVELQKQERDYRRRRQTYRAKNVHNNRKSRVEILREVLANQMQLHFGLDINTETLKSTNRTSSNEGYFPSRGGEQLPEPEVTVKSEVVKRSRSLSRSRERPRKRSRNRSPNHSKKKKKHKKHHKHKSEHD